MNVSFILLFIINMKTFWIVSQEDRWDWTDTQFNVFEKEENARACFDLLCKEAYDAFHEDYQIERRDGYMYIDDVYIYIEMFQASFDDKERESWDLYSNLRKKYDN